MDQLQIYQITWKCKRAAITDMYKNFMLLYPMFDNSPNGHNLKRQALGQMESIVAYLEALLGQYPATIELAQMSDIKGTVEDAHVVVDE